MSSTIPSLLLPVAPLLVCLLFSCQDHLADVQPLTTSGAQTAVQSQGPEIPITGVKIDVQQAQALVSQGNRLVLTDVASGSYNLLTPNSEVMLLFTTTRLPAGSVDGFRLLLGPNSQIRLQDGSLHPLDTPSGTTSGLKIQLKDAVARPNMQYQVRVHFSVERDIVRRGNGTFGLKPVLKGEIVHVVSVPSGT